MSAERESSPLRPIVELGVDEAYRFLAQQLGDAEAKELPPLDAIENEDWGRDWLLSRLAECSDEELRQFGLTRG